MFENAKYLLKHTLKTSFVGWGVLLDRMGGLGLSGGGCGAKYGRTSEKVNMPKLVMPETF